MNSCLESSTSSSSRSTSLSQNLVSQNSPNFRSISLIESINFKFDGNISKNALVLDDCDNDGKNELLVGTLNGELLIFKGNSTVPIEKAKDLGMISCIVVGDILAKDMNYIITISIEGYLNIFAFIFECVDHNSVSMNRRGSNFSGSFPFNNNVKLPPTITEELSGNNQFSLVHFQQIQANAMCALIADIDNDGNNELIVALSDRVVRSYRAVHSGDDMKLVGIHKWEFSDQIGSIALSTFWEQNNTTNSANDENDKIQRSSILVAQHGGIFAQLNCWDATIVNNITIDDEDPEAEDNFAIGITPKYQTISLPPQRNPQISAEIIADIGNNTDCTEAGKLISIATSDGLLVLLRDEDITWQCQLEQKIQSLKKHDIDGDGRDELVICTWNGQTYFVDLDCRIVTCQFDQPVSAFTVGHYDLNGQRMSCLVYGTFTNSLHLYYNIDCSFALKNSDNVFFEFIRTNHLPLMEQLTAFVTKLNSESDEEGGEKKQFKIDSKLINSILYGITTIDINH